MKNFKIAFFTFLLIFATSAVSAVRGVWIDGNGYLSSNAGANLVWMNATTKCDFSAITLSQTVKSSAIGFSEKINTGSGTLLTSKNSVGPYSTPTFSVTVKHHMKNLATTDTVYTYHTW